MARNRQCMPPPCGVCCYCCHVFVKDIGSQYRVCVPFYNNPVYVKFLLDKHWPVGWGVIEVHWDEPNVVCPFINVCQGFYYVG